jgi:hypothetical protein
VDLVSQLPKPEAGPRLEHADTATVLVTGNPSEASLVRSMLEGSGVDVAVLDENLSRVYLSVAIGGMKVVVPKDQEELALDVLKEYRGQAAQNSQEEVGGSGSEEYRCLHCRALLEPETIVCEKCGRQPFE